jgi:hypothetical protein
MSNALKGWLGLALAIGWPLIPMGLIQYGRHQGWQQHRECIAEEVRRLTTAEEVLSICQELP